MPIYEYGCSQCGKTQDVMQKMSDPAPTTCGNCGAENTLSRQVSRTSFVLKGGGWYSDLYGSTNKGSSGSSSAKSESSSASSSPAKSESSSASSSTPAATPAAASGK
jgi:putative FmdB family regulatory protein